MIAEAGASFSRFAQVYIKSTLDRFLFGGEGAFFVLLIYFFYCIIFYLLL